jgi:PadR family transcriptional regulator PadR
MEPGGARNPWSQLRRGVLEYCVLALLESSGELYAFDLVSRLSGVDGMVTSEGTIYPLLSRLRSDGWVATSWRESDAGPPRRYYAITPAGRHALTGFQAEWRRFRTAVDTLLGTRGDRGGDRG